MTSFSYDNRDLLIHFLSLEKSIHDGKITKIKSGIYNKEWSITIENEYTSSTIEILFKGVTMFTSVGTGKWGNDYSISSLTLEEPEEMLKHTLEVEMIDLSEALYLVFQLFSGDEIRIVCQNVYFIAK